MLVVTGASGMLGHHAIERLERDHRQDTWLTSRTRPRRLPAGMPWRRWDLRERLTPDQLDRRFPGATAVLHLGAIIPGTPDAEVPTIVRAVNADATATLAAWAAARAIPMVFVSSSLVYADQYAPSIGEDAPTAGSTDPYVASKLLAETRLHSLVAEGASIAVLRPSSVYGHGLSERAMVVRFLETAAAGRTIELARPVEDEVNLVHACDVIEAALLALGKRAAGVFNIAADEPTSIIELARACLEVVGRGGVSVRAGEAGREAHCRFALDCRRAKSQLGFAQHVDLRTGLAAMWCAMQRGTAR